MVRKDRKQTGKQKFKFTQKTDSDPKKLLEIIREQTEKWTAAEVLLKRERERYVLCMKAHVYEFSHLLLLQEWGAAHQLKSFYFDKKNLLYHPPNDICSYNSSNAFIWALSLDIPNFAPFDLFWQSNCFEPNVIEASKRTKEEKVVRLIYFFGKNKLHVRA